MVVECEDCGESICSDCDGERIGPGKYVCEDCMEEREDAEAEAKLANMPEPAEPKVCLGCNTTTRTYIEKNEGTRCIRCAHKLELELYGGEHDVASCPICTPAKAA